MGENGNALRRKNTAWSARAMAFGSTGLAAAVTLLMVLAPASAGVAPLKVMTPAYKHTVSQTNSYLSQSGCAKAKTVAGKWNPGSGTLTGLASSSSSSCPKVLGGVGAYSSGYAQTSMVVAVPFTVSKGGNHSISEAISVNLAESSALTTGACPAKNVNYNPPLYGSSYAYCEAGAFVEWEMYAYLADLSNNSWYNYNSSSAFAYNSSYITNYTDCYNYGTPSCSNSSYGSSYGYAYGYNAPGFSSSTFMWNGATSFSMWNNGTNMVRGHHYILEVNMYVYTDTYVDAYNLLGHWAASASGLVNMATLGNGATVSSITVS
jgi:hypothetical protein